MLDQNITTLLAALIGGLLSVLGGFIANYYIQSSTDKLSKKKEIRNILEQMYKKTQAVYLSYGVMIMKIASNEEIETNIAAISETMNEMEFLVNFYIHPLKNAFISYYESIMKTDLFWGKILKDNIDSAIEIKTLKTSTDRFREEIIKIAKKEGYNYFQ